MHNLRSPLTQFCIAMMFVVEALKDPEFAAEMRQGSEVLGAKEALVVRVVKSFDNAITPGFAFRDEDDFDSKMQTEPDQEAKASGVAIRPPEGKLIVDLEISGDPQTLPLVHESPADGHIMLCEDGIQGDGITADIDEMEAVETNSVREIARPHQVQLLCHARLRRFDFRITRAWELWQDGRAKLVSMDNAVDRPNTGDGVDPKSP